MKQRKGEDYEKNKKYSSSIAAGIRAQFVLREYISAGGKENYMAVWNV
jgi:hypothetical protein